ncbi:MAG: RHS repeat-associated core domain-containing protein [Terracidiphilus sp.]
MLTDYAGTAEESCHSLPYGNGEDCGTVRSAHLFTGKERDAESGNDYFGARYYASSMGRFLSPDDPILYQDKEDPQTWNLYTYVRNNPLNRVDPNGHLKWLQ